MNNDFMKTSVPDIKNIPSENTIVENTIPSPDITQEDGGNINTPTSENSTTPVENTNQIANNEIVKENDSNSVDNNDNNRKINKKVESFLLKKYKIK